MSAGEKMGQNGSKRVASPFFNPCYPCYPWLNAFLFGTQFSPTILGAYDNTCQTLVFHKEFFLTTDNTDNTDGTDEEKENSCLPAKRWDRTSPSGLPLPSLIRAIRVIRG